MTPVRLEPVAPLSRVKHSTTEPLHSPYLGYTLGKIWNNKIVQLEFYDTEKPVLRGHLKIDKTKVLMENGSLMQVESITECSPWSILQ